MDMSQGKTSPTSQSPTASVENSDQNGRIDASSSANQTLELCEDNAHTLEKESQDLSDRPDKICSDNKPSDVPKHETPDKLNQLQFSHSPPSPKSEPAQAQSQANIDLNSEPGRSCENMDTSKPSKRKHAEYVVPETDPDGQEKLCVEMYEPAVKSERTLCETSTDNCNIRIVEPPPSSTNKEHQGRKHMYVVSKVYTSEQKQPLPETAERSTSNHRSMSSVASTVHADQRNHPSQTIQMSTLNPGCMPSKGSTLGSHLSQARVVLDPAARPTDGSGGRYENWQYDILETYFQRNQYASWEDRRVIEKKTNLSDRKIQVWFQNKRRPKKCTCKSKACRANKGNHGTAKHGTQLKYVLQNQDLITGIQMDRNQDLGKSDPKTESVPESVPPPSQSNSQQNLRGDAFDQHPAPLLFPASELNEQMSSSDTLEEDVAVQNKTTIKRGLLKVCLEQNKQLVAASTAGQTIETEDAGNPDNSDKPSTNTMNVESSAETMTLSRTQAPVQRPPTASTGSNCRHHHRNGFVMVHPIVVPVDQSTSPAEEPETSQAVELHTEVPVPEARPQRPSQELGAGISVPQPRHGNGLQTGHCTPHYAQAFSEPKTSTQASQMMLTPRPYTRVPVSQQAYPHAFLARSHIGGQHFSSPLYFSGYIHMNHANSGMPQSGYQPLAMARSSVDEARQVYPSGPMLVNTNFQYFHNAGQRAQVQNGMGMYGQPNLPCYHNVGQNGMGMYGQSTRGEGQSLLRPLPARPDVAEPQIPHSTVQTPHNTVQIPRSTVQTPCSTVQVARNSSTQTSSQQPPHYATPVMRDNVTSQSNIEVAEPTQTEPLDLCMRKK